MSIKRNIEAEEAEQETDEFRSTLWAVNLADLMTFLMIFFLLLFSFYFQMAQSPEMAVRVKAGLKSIETKFGSRFGTSAIVHEIAASTVILGSGEVISPAANTSIATPSPIRYPFKKNLTRRDFEKIMTDAYNSAMKKNADYRIYLPSIALASDETASYYVSEIVIPVRIAVKKVPIVPAPVPTTPAGMQIYVVQHGDTLWGICLKFNLDPDVAMHALSRSNKLNNPSLILPGQKLMILLPKKTTNK